MVIDDDQDPLTVIGSVRVLPVLTLEDHALAGPLGDALATGGLTCVEVTFRTTSAAATIATLAADPRLTVGAGTVLGVDAADRAIDAGARFVVSPGFDAAVVAHCQRRGVAVLPGVATATEVMTARRSGLDVLKFFPAEAAGGLGMLTAIQPVFPTVSFIPTGGIGPGNLAAYLAHPEVLAVGGSWMVSPRLLREADLAGVTHLAAEAASLARGVPRAAAVDTPASR